MVESIAGLWRHAPMLALAVVAIAVVWGLVRVVRSRKPAAPARKLPFPVAPEDPANLDSSHIGGPLFESTVDPYGRLSGPITKGSGH